MNTPRSKPSVRWTKPTRKGPPKTAAYWGIKDPEIAASLGFMISYWSQVEERMIWFLNALLRGNRDTTPVAMQAARLIFRSIASENARIKVMTALLEMAPHNAGRGPKFDEVLAEFSALNQLRNKYVHGLWRTETNESGFVGRVLLADPRQDMSGHGALHAVKATEINAVTSRMSRLFTKIGRCA